MKNPSLGRLALASLGLFLGAAFPALAQTTTHKSIPLDCGGWFSGFDISSGGRIYGYGDVFGVWRSDAGQAGNSWRYLLGNLTTHENFVSGISAAATNADIVVFLSSAKVIKSTDGGVNWTTMLTGLKGPSKLDRGSKPILIHPTNSNEIWLARTRTGYTGLLWRSTDGGTSWDKVGGSTFDTVRPINVYVRPEFPDQIWVGAVGGLYVSTNRGSSWTLVWNNGGLNNPAYPNDPAIVKSIARRADGIAYFAANIGGFRVTATDWANPATYVCTVTVNRHGGQGPVAAAVLANGDFVTTTIEGHYMKRSSDGGQTWTDLAATLITPPTPAWTVPATSTSKASGGRDMIIADPTNQSRWFMTGGESPVISTDSGATWKYPPILNGLAGVPTYSVSFPRGNSNMVLIAGADQGVFTLDDGGASRDVDTSSSASLNHHQAFHDVMSSDNGQTLVAAGVHQSTSETLIIRSTNGGVSWAPVTYSGLPTSYEGVTRAVAAPGNVNDFLVLLGYNWEVSRNNPGLYRTTNGGASFTKVSGIPDGVDTGSRYHPENSWLRSDGVNTNTRYLSLRASNNSSARGFYRSTDGGSNWAKTATQPIDSDWIIGMAVDPVTAGRIWIAGGYRGVRRSDNGGDSWTLVSGFTMANSISAHNGRIAVFGQRSGDTWMKLYYSLDNGVTWSEKTGTNNRYPFLSDVTVDPYRIGQIWVSGLSVNVVDTGTASSGGSTGGTGGASTSISLSNAGFESDTSQTPAGWSSSASTSAHLAADYAEAWRPRSGSIHLSHWMPSSAYQIYTYRVVTGLTNGTYTAKAWTLNTGGQKSTSMQVKNYGGSTLSASLPVSETVYTERVISNINVTNGQLEIGFWSDAYANQWIAVDDVSLTRTSP